MRSDQTRCGLDAALDIIGGKWKTLILWELDAAPKRFGELRRAVEGISEKMLIQQVREMEADGIVHRRQYNEVPPRVEYSVTPFGASLNEALAPLCDWGERNMERIERGPRIDLGEDGAARAVGEPAASD